MYNVLTLKKKAQYKSFKLSFVWGKMNLALTELCRVHRSEEAKLAGNHFHP